MQKNELLHIQTDIFFALFILKEAEAWKSWRGWNVDSVENMGALWGKWSLLILDPECFRPINFANFADFYTSSRAQYVFKLPFHWGFLRGCSKLYREKTKLFEIDINGMNKRLFSKNIEEEKKSSLLSGRQYYNCYLAFMIWGLNDVRQLILFETIDVVLDFANNIDIFSSHISEKL